MWCVWESRGGYEWLVHPDLARDLLATGMKIDDEWVPVEKIGEWPNVGRWHIRAEKPKHRAFDEWVPGNET